MLHIMYFPEITRDAGRQENGRQLNEDLELWADWHGAHYLYYTPQREVLGDPIESYGVNTCPAVRVIDSDTSTGFLLEGWLALGDELWGFLDTYAPKAEVA